MKSNQTYPIFLKKASLKSRIRYIKKLFVSNNIVNINNIPCLILKWNLNKEEIEVLIEQNIQKIMYVENLFWEWYYIKYE